MNGDVAGHGLIRLDAAGTASLAVVTLATGISDASAVVMANLVVSSVLFVGGCIGFGIGFVRAARRSRDEVIDLAGLFYLTGSAPTPIRKLLLGLWFAQIAIAVGAIALSDPPFGVMAPVWGIGLITWWASLHATFPPREGASRH